MVAYSGADAYNPIGAADVLSRTAIDVHHRTVGGGDAETGMLTSFFGTLSNGSITPPSG